MSRRNTTTQAGAGARSRSDGAGPSRSDAARVRNGGPGPEDAILDAARETVLAVGVRRATVSEVARRARLSRMTVYRRHPDAAALLRAVMAREFEQVIARAEADVAAERPARRRLVAATIRTAHLLATNPVMVRVLELDPELLLPYLTVRVGRFQEFGRHILADRIATGQREGWIGEGDPARMAAAIELALRGIVIAGASMSARARTTWMTELETMIDRYLAGPPAAAGRGGARSGSRRRRR